MLVLSRKESEKIKLGDDIVLTIVRVTGDRVRLGIEAPPELLILREELDPNKDQDEKKVAQVHDQKTQVSLSILDEQFAESWILKQFETEAR